MANGRVKTEMTGTGGGRWGPRAVIKDIADKQRRQADKEESLIEAAIHISKLCGKPEYVIMSAELYHTQRKKMYIGLGHSEEEAQKLADDDVEDLRQPETD